MIISVDHIAMSSLDIKRDVQNAQLKGYSCLFCEKLVNLKTKQQFLSKWQDLHTLAFCENKNGYNIELLNHGQITKNKGYIEFIKDNEVTIKTPDTLKSIILWKLLGFQKIQNNRLVFSSFFAKTPLYINLVEIKDTPKRQLDDFGCNCMGFITSSVTNEHAKLKEICSKITDIEELCVNDNDMKIFFAQYNSNEIIEVIEIIKK